MGYKYSTIKLNDQFTNYKDENNTSLIEISDLSSINVIVGSNNSGKSRFLRELIKTKDFEFKIKGLDLKELNENLRGLENGMRELGKKHQNVVTFSVNNLRELKPNNLSLFFPNEVFNKTFFTEKPLEKTLELLNYYLKTNFVMNEYSFGNSNIKEYEGDLKNYLNSNIQLLETIKSYSIEEINFKRFYIPTLRSLNYIGYDETHKEIDFYHRRIASKYKLDEKELNLKIFTGLSLYRTIRSMLLGDLDERKKISQYEKFLSIKLFEGKEVALIPKEKDDVLHIKIGNEERAIYDLGDGIQSIIILTFPLFEVDNGIFFIEEPEMHLHPGLQRKLIEVWKEMKNHQYFITTHSNHFLDLTLDYTDTSIYTFNKKDENTIVKLVSHSDENILQLLGAKNSSVFLSNCTIWVEGITDRLYIRKYLEFFQADKTEKMQEDIDYSFVEYGGDNITHWSFLNEEENPINIERLCGKSFLITDKDGDKKMERKAQLQSNLGDRYKILDCEEIENTLSLKTIERVLRKYEKNSSFEMPFFKTPIPHKDLRIGRFIEDKIFKDQPITRKGGYKEKSGTIKNKVDFCKKAIDEMTIDEISPIALNLAEDIYSFIKSKK